MDPNATAQQVKDIMGQLYDPSSDTESNLQRIHDFYTEQSKKGNAIEEASKRYHKTGYATIGGGGELAGARPATTGPVSPLTDEEPGTEDDAGAEAAYQQALKEQGRTAPVQQKQVARVLQNKKTGQKRIIYTDGTEEVQ
jgi:hypothetical protein